MRQIRLIILLVVTVVCSTVMCAMSKVNGYNEGRNVSEDNFVCYVTFNEEDDATGENVERHYVLLFHVKDNTNATFIQMNYQPANKQTAKRVSAGSAQIRKNDKSPREFYKEFLEELFGVDNLTYLLKKR